MQNLITNLTIIVVYRLIREHRFHYIMIRQVTDKYQAISATYEEMRSSLFSIFRQVNIPEEECKDLVQDVFVRLLSIDTLRLETIKGITATIALRMRTDYLRHRAFVRKMYSDVDTADIFDYGYHDTSLDTAELASNEMKIVEGMSNKNRKVYELSRFEEQSYNEIAEILNMSYRSVESRLYRARNEVRQTLRKVYGM